MPRKGDRVFCDMSFSTLEIDDGFVKGIASSPSTDLYGHKVVAGAFDKSIMAKGLTGPRGIKLLAHHDWHKPAGIIKRLETVRDNLEIEAQLNLNVSYVKDLYEVTKQNGGLSFSVGFTLEDFDFNLKDEDEEFVDDGEPWLIVKSGDLMEVSIVCFPACVEAEMTFVKNKVDTMADFEKALVADGLCRSRGEAHRYALFAKTNVHLLQGKTLPLAEPPDSPRPLLDVNGLQAATDLAVRVKALLGGDPMRRKGTGL